MCTNPNGPWEAWDGSFNYDYGNLKQRVLKDRVRFDVGDTIYLTGGEPTIHPDFIKFIDFLIQEFPTKRIILLTNGRRFYYKDFARELLDKCPNIEIHVSLYGHDKEIHEKITQAKGSYDQSLAGLKNLLKHKNVGQVVAVRHVLSSISYKQVGDFLRLMADELPMVDRVILMFWEIEAQAEKNLEYLKLRYTDARLFIKSVNDYKNKIKEIRLYHFPLCQLDECLWPLAWCTWPRHEVDFLDACEKCQVKKYCVGIHKAYMKNIGSDEFVPILNQPPITESGDVYKPISAVE
jgi:MoaA/NifB/PqqE/SkfB family radical SAM enzyme